MWLQGRFWSAPGGPEVAVYVVTGGAGFIGSNIARRLIGLGEEVRVVDDLSTGHKANLRGLGQALTFYEEDILDLEVLRRAFAGADVVLHQAALASVPKSVENPLQANAVNVEGTLNVLLAARDCGVKRVVCASTCALYGDDPEIPKREDMTPMPKSPYAVSKLAAETYCRVFYEVFGLETVSLRYFNVYGPQQDPHSQYAAVVPIFVYCLMQQRRPRVFGDGEQSRDFVFVDDVVEANLEAARSPGVAGMVLNIGSGEGRTINEVLQLVREAMGADLEPEYCEERLGDVRHSQADIGKACEALGYEPQVSLKEGLRRTVEWYKGQERTTLFLDGPESA
jgi:nucleoside-diphosphate-sugar epimerase